MYMLVSLFYITYLLPFSYGDSIARSLSDFITDTVAAATALTFSVKGEAVNDRYTVASSTTGSLLFHYKMPTVTNRERWKDWHKAGPVIDFHTAINPWVK